MKAPAKKSRVITPREFAREMRRIASRSDIEDAHREADDLLCKVLRKLGYRSGAGVFANMERWYS